MNNNLGVVFGGLKCDNPKCDFVDMSIEFKDYKEWVNRPCPICGENLLTEEDFEAANQMVKIAEIANTIEIDDTSSENFSCHFNGTGNIAIDISGNGDTIDITKEGLNEVVSILENITRG